MTGSRAPVAALVVSAAPAAAIAQPRSGWESMWDHPMMWGGGWMMLLFWGGLIALVVLLLRRSGGSSDRGSRDPLDLLKERYARGEIDEAEYRTRRQVLEER